MREPEKWKPSKFEPHAGGWRASRDAAFVGAGSRLYVELLARTLFGLISTHARGRLIDLGCGDVPLYGAYRGLASEVTCSDWGHSRHGTSHIDFECDLNQALPFDSSSFDTVILSDVLEHLFEPAALWKEMSRILRPNGTVICSVPFFYWLHETPHDYFRYTEFALRRFAAEASLQVLTIRPIGGSIEVMADMLAKHIVRLPLIGKALALGLQSMTWWWSGSGAGRRAIATTARYMPLGYVIVASKSTAQ